MQTGEWGFRARAGLTNQAEKTIDAQYYIWEEDDTGFILAERILRAADRGVRVRLLVDDIYVAARDRAIAALCQHPYFDIKIFNPGQVRHSKLGGLGEFMLRFKELNRRMHNKLLVVDGRAAVVGGRNIGNAYFGLSKKYNFCDLDVLVVGPVIEEIGHAFDEYWNNDLSYPGIAMSTKIQPEDVQRWREELSKRLSEYQEVLASYPLEPKQWDEELSQLSARMETGKARFLQDEPVRFGDDEIRLLDMLRRLSERNREELIIVSPYLIPRRAAWDNLDDLVAEGVHVTILTASMASNNHTMAHSHYRKYRRRILEGGAELYEFRHDPSSEVRERVDVAPVRADFVSLHVKTMVGDRQRCFIGSLNQDPRAIEINTENGLYIESPGLSKQLADYVDSLLSPDNAWRVYLNEKDKMRWDSTAGVVSSQPARSFCQRIADFFYRLLPIEKQL